LDRYYAEVTLLHQSRERKLEKKVREQKHFLNTVVHDLRNPSESVHQGLMIARDIIKVQMKEQIDRVATGLDDLMS